MSDNNDHDQFAFPQNRSEEYYLSLPWFGLFQRTYPTQSKEMLIFMCKSMHGSLEEAAKTLTELYQATGCLPPNPNAPPVQRCKAIGRQPFEGEKIVYYDIDERYSLRIWGGDLKDISQFSFGFYDRLQGRPVNTPPDYTLWQDMPGHYVPLVQLRSLEECFRMLESCPDGMQSYVVVQGETVKIKRKEGKNYHDIATFRMPLWSEW
ncbi:hypothetical protein QCA50_016751 [Cerrena zonata]|uniref:Uncharacterized protein n=1 Tax=Cerrena zonata TaxID=2478898 RepID=A0AAW0FJ39_9APHY